MKNTDDSLKELKIALGISENNDAQDDLLSLYLRDAESELRLLLSLNDEMPVPTGFKVIIRGAAVKKFNRFKNEGMKSYSQEGESISFTANDFNEWQQEIKQYRKDHDGEDEGMWVNPYEIWHKSNILYGAKRAV